MILEKHQYNLDSNKYIDNLPETQSLQEENFNHRINAAAVEHAELQVQSYKDDLQARKEYAKKLYSFTEKTAKALAVLILLNGLCSLFGLTFVSNTVLISLISLLGVNIIGALIVVMKYLFPANRYSRKE